jgi:hypothetical protein
LDLAGDSEPGDVNAPEVGGLDSIVNVEQKQVNTVQQTVQPVVGHLGQLKSQGLLGLTEQH